MKKSITIAGAVCALKKPLIIMKLSLILIVFCSFHSFAGASAQTITLNAANKEIVKVLSAIEKQGDFRFVYNSGLKELKQKVSVSFNKAVIKDVLKELFAGTNLSYVELDNNLVAIRSNNVADIVITVTGKITNSNGEPVPGVSVRIKGSSTGTSSTNDGSYSITVPDGATLQFSSVGYENEEVVVGSRTTIDVVLRSATKLIEEVVVVGYGTQRKKDVTGAVASVRGADIAMQPVQTATQAIQGKVSGVQIITSGEPNALPTVRIRGTGSVLAGANPLYVVDGVLTDDIRNINSNDIVTFDVLKDASATAIYGVRGANGVIIITTKKGRNGKTIFSYNGNSGIREAANLVDMAGEKQYAGYLNEASLFYGSGSELIPASSLKGNNTDWYDEILRTAFQTNHSLSASGGSDKFLYFLSGGYLNEEGILENSKYSRYTVRSNTEYSFTPKVKFSSQLSYTGGDARGGQFSAFGDAYRASPLVEGRKGNLFGNTSGVNGANVANPLLNIDKNYNKVLANKIQGNFAFDVKPIKDITLRSAINFEKDDVNSTSYAYRYLSDSTTFTTLGGNQSNPNSTLTLAKVNGSKLIWDNTATYNKVINKHAITTLVGFVAQRDKATGLLASARDVPENMNQWYVGAGTPSTRAIQDDGVAKRTRLSYLGRVNYAFDNKYLLTATFRADATSNFSKDNRWGYFPSIALGWNITNEDFMADQQLFNALKLRASYGLKGNDNIGAGQYTQVANIGVPYYFGGNLSQGIVFDQIVDKNIKWETTNEVDFGLDFTMLKNRLNGTVDYYSKKTKDALINIGLPGIFPDPSYITNATTISNKGVELALNWNDKIATNWNYSIGGNISHNKNNIEKLNGGQPISAGQAGNFQVTKTDNGREIASYFLLENIGIFQNQAQIDASAQPNARAGDLIYRDISGLNGKPDGKIDNLDRAYFGSYQPDITYGINGTLSYKAFDMSMGVYGTAGAKIYNAKKAVRGLQPTDNIEANVAKNRWTPNNPNGGVPRANLNAEEASTYFLESGDFLRMNNLSIGYTIPSATLAKSKFTNFRVYVTSQNLFTITPYSGFSPEVQTVNVLDSGVDGNTYPTTRTFAIGVNVGF